MAKIKYEIDGKTIDIEVSEEFAKEYEALVTEEQRLEWREKKHKDSSLDVMTDAGFQPEDLTVDIESEVIKKDEIQRLYLALEMLKPKQRWLIKQVFFLGRSQSDVARELGVDRTTIRDRLNTIYAILRNLL